MFGLNTYVVGAILVALLAVAGYGLYERGNAANARADSVASQFATYRAEAEKEAADLRARAAKVAVKVVTEYKDRVVTIRETSPEVIHDIQIIRDSRCELPGEFRVLHDSAATGSSAQAPAGVDDASAPVDCATAIETIRENYKRARENAAELEAIQKWAASLQP